MRRKGIMLCYPFEERRLHKWPKPYVVQPKLDGIRCRAVPTSSGYTLLSSEENTIFLPHIVNELNKLKLSIELDGEIYIHGVPFEKLASMTLRTTNPHPSSSMLEYHIFDIVSPKHQLLRLDDLANLNLQPPLVRVKHDFAFSIEDVTHYLRKYIDEKYEGVIVRNIFAMYERKRSPNIMKFKPLRTDTYLITGYKEEISIHGEPKNSLGALEVFDGCNYFSVGSGFTREDRQLLWEMKEELIGKYVEIAYQHTTAKNCVPRFPVFVRVVDNNEEEYQDVTQHTLC